VRDILFVGDGRNGRSLIQLAVSDNTGPHVASLPMPDWMNETVEIDIVRDLGAQMGALAEAFARAEAERGEPRHVRGVLLACNKGHNRSPALALAFLLHHCGLSLRASYRRVLRARPGIDPLPNYRAALVRHERALRAQSTVSDEGFSLHISELLRRTGDDYDRAIEHRTSSIRTLLSESDDEGSAEPPDSTVSVPLSVVDTHS
jgi:protein-tyrosine phosphatase